MSHINKWKILLEHLHKKWKRKFKYQDNVQAVPCRASLLVTISLLLIWKIIKRTGISSESFLEWSFVQLLSLGRLIFFFPVWWFGSYLLQFCVILVLLVSHHCFLLAFTVTWPLCYLISWAVGTHDVVLMGVCDSFRGDHQRSKAEMNGTEATQICFQQVLEEAFCQMQ